tara:strand:+ start:179 stop:826 length:648 start_codon:yes stop_codon:yes gene_type:complete
MNYDAIILKLKPVIIQALQNLGEEKIDMNITAVKKVTNSIVSDYFRGTDNSIVNNSLMNINSMFSGRGRAWARLDVDPNCKAWQLVECTLLNAHLEGYEEYFTKNLLDLFQEKGFAWMRFGNTSKKGVLFHLRHKGSKLEESVKIYLSKELVLKSINNLNGVPHGLDLEQGIFIKEEKKEVVNIPVNKDELDSMGIFSLESLLEEDIQNSTEIFT